jgi:hypothetical protein
VARPDLSVITEDQYFDFYNRPNEVFSYTFLQVLRDWPCLFIGLSMTDDNVRRLLYYSYRERRTSYEREGRAPDQAHAASVRHFALFGPQVSDRLRRVTQQGLTQLGVSTIWLDRFDDLPTLMQDVYCTSGEEWPGGMPGKRSCVRRDERPA